MDNDELVRKFSPVAKAFEKAVTTVKGAGDPTDYESISDQLLFISVRDKVQQWLSEQMGEIRSFDMNAKGTAHRHLEVIGQADVAREIEERVNQIVQELLHQPPSPPRRKRVPDIAYQILEEAGASLHFREIAKRVTERDVVLGGKDPALTLRAYLQRDPRFLLDRSKRGFWKPTVSD